MHILLVIHECNPEWSSVPLVGYNFYHYLRQRVKTTLVTHQRNKPALERVRGDDTIVYIAESELARQYYNFSSRLAERGTVNWPLYHVLTYPIYAEFNHRVFKQFAAPVQRGEYDLVHAMTPMMPRYPVKLVKACRQTPFLLGPINGGVPFPPGFRATARKEKSYLNFFRALGRYLIPGYRTTYRKATHILAGSTYTLDLVKRLFDLPDDRISLFYENGILAEFLQASRPPKSSDYVNVLFVGRLVPYKGADMLIEALSQLPLSVLGQVRATIVGDGSERGYLEALVAEKGLQPQVEFIGWIQQHETLDYYNQADVFCFPSVREFGGAVVLEAMACGLPCIVVNNGGIGEYVTSSTGFKIDPISRSYVIQQLTTALTTLITDQPRRVAMGEKAVERAAEFEWSRKAEAMLQVYDRLLSPQPI